MSQPITYKVKGCKNFAIFVTSQENRRMKITPSRQAPNQIPQEITNTFCDSQYNLPLQTTESGKHYCNNKHNFTRKSKNRVSCTRPWGTKFVIACAFLAVLGVWGTWFWFAFPNGGKDSLGTFGDSFGSIGSLFSALAFAGVIWSIFLQRQELNAQREEMREQREEFELQTQNLKQQRFETSFFKQLDVLSAVSLRLDGGLLTVGTNALSEYWQRFDISLKNHNLSISYPKDDLVPSYFNFSLIRYENLFLQILNEIETTHLLETSKERKYFQQILWNLRDENELRYLILRAYEERKQSNKKFQLFWNSGLLEELDLLRFFRLPEPERLLAAQLLKQELDSCYKFK